MPSDAADFTAHMICDTENHRTTVSLSKCTNMYNFLLFFFLRTAHPVFCTVPRKELIANLSLSKR